MTLRQNDLIRDVVQALRDEHDADLDEYFGDYFVNVITFYRFNEPLASDDLDIIPGEIVKNASQILKDRQKTIVDTDNSVCKVCGPDPDPQFVSLYVERDQGMQSVRELHLLCLKGIYLNTSGWLTR